MHPRLVFPPFTVGGEAVIIDAAGGVTTRVAVFETPP
jgi:hypothetical protein